jgi:hypothetical protein
MSSLSIHSAVSCLLYLLSIWICLWFHTFLCTFYFSRLFFFIFCTRLHDFWFTELCSTDFSMKVETLAWIAFVYIIIKILMQLIVFLNQCKCLSAPYFKILHGIIIICYLLKLMFCIFFFSFCDFQYFIYFLLSTVF